MFGFKKEQPKGVGAIQEMAKQPSTNFEWHARRIGELEDQLQALYRYFGIFPSRDTNITFKKLKEGSAVLSTNLDNKKD